MIAVIADDLSGAAELAGIAWRAGLSAEIWTGDLAALDGAGPPETDVVAIDTDSRQIPPERAARLLSQVVSGIVAGWEPEWIFKKTDSVLRGNIAAELAALPNERVWFVPANPSRARQIRDGRYSVSGVPLHRTHFAQDPTHPARTDVVRDQLGLKDDRILTPDAASPADLETIVGRVAPDDATAGAADFFAALLARRFPIKQGRIGDPTGYDRNGEKGWRAFVCGSKAAWGDRRARFEAKGWPVWVLGGRLDFRAAPAVLLGIGDDPGPAFPGEPAALCEVFAREVTRILDREKPVAVLAEGGATAVALCRCWGASRFRVVGEAGPGAPWLEAVDRVGLPPLCVKPGSYPWPVSLLED